MKFLNTIVSTFMLCLGLALLIEFFRHGSLIAMDWTKFLILALGVGIANGIVQQYREKKK